MALDYIKRLPSGSDATLLLQLRDAVTTMLIDIGLTHTGGGCDFGGADCGFEAADRLIDEEVAVWPRFEGGDEDPSGGDAEDRHGATSQPMWRAPAPESAPRAGHAAPKQGGTQ